MPGKPDLVFMRRRKVIFVHGCFWHGHECSLGRIPKSKIEFWTTKIATNRQRDGRQIEELSSEGWCSLVIWECQLKDMLRVEKSIKSFLG